MFMRIRHVLLYLSFGLLPTCSFCSDIHEETFTRIYDQGVWGRNSEGRGFSGMGSIVSHALPYMNYLQQFLLRHSIKTVVDLGCGDWEFSRHIDWNGINYTGFDVVKSVVERNQQQFGSSSIRFIHANILSTDLPPADLLICKDVLQHLSNNDILSLIPKLSKYKFCLITNDTTPGVYTGENIDIQVGGGRKLDLGKSPFFLKGKKVLNYQYDKAGGCKQVFLIEQKL